jgi:hypothetical protein
LCLPAASVLPIANNENFGTFSFYEQLSDKRSDIPLGATYRVREQRASGVKQQSCTLFLGARYLDLLQCI